MLFFKKKITNNGFTLIELLVVIGIIWLLSTVVLASLAGTRPRARDARRLAEVKQMGLIISIESTSFSTSRTFTGCTAADALTSICTGPGSISEFSSFSDPSGTAACNVGSTGVCDYSISKSGGVAGATIDDYQICFYLEDPTASGQDQSLLSVTSPSGNITTGCN